MWCTAAAARSRRRTATYVAWDAMLALAQQAGTSQAAYMQLQGKNLDGTPNPATPPLLGRDQLHRLHHRQRLGRQLGLAAKQFLGRARPRSARPRPGSISSIGTARTRWGTTVPARRSTADDVQPGDNARQRLGSGRHERATDNAGRPHILLSNNPEYRMLFADRVHRLLFNDGILTPDKLIERYQALTDQLELAIIGESARWGDMQAHRSPAPNRALTPADWVNERDWLLGLPNTRRRRSLLAQSQCSFAESIDRIRILSEHGRPDVQPARRAGIAGIRPHACRRRPARSGTRSTAPILGRLAAARRRRGRRSSTRVRRSTFRRGSP